MRSKHYRTAAHHTAPPGGSTHEEGAMSPDGSKLEGGEARPGRLLDLTLTGGAEVDPMSTTEDEEMVSWWRGQARFNSDN